LPRELAAPQDGDFIGESHDLAEFVGDHQDGQRAAPDHVAQHAQHLVGLAGREHRGRLVENEETALQIKLLEDFAFLPLAGGDGRYLGVERHAKRHVREKLFQRLAFARPVHHRGNVIARQHEILRHRHGRHRGEVLIDHAETQRMRGARIADDLLAVIDQKLAPSAW
jgi:hypothetical protein